tara:strand:- start:2706 stop:3491 length:786 start_codon:yes stop_codon:yes gene_type:complete
MNFDEHIKKVFQVHIKTKEIKVEEKLLTNYEIENRLFNYKSTCLSKEELNEFCEQMISSEIYATKKELEYINSIFNNTSPFIKFIIKKKYYKLFFFKDKKTIKEIKKLQSRKSFLDKKYNNLHDLVKNIPISINLKTIDNADFELERSDIIDPSTNDNCYCIKIFNDDREFRSFINIKKSNFIPTKIKKIGDNKYFLNISINERKGSEYSSLIPISDILENNRVKNSKKIIFPNKEELKSFLFEWKKSFDNDFNMMLESIY